MSDAMTLPRPAARQIGTHGRLVDSALHLFALNGFDGASTREICQRAGSNLAGIKYHFGGKEGLYQAVIEQVVADMNGLLAPATVSLRQGVAAAAGNRAVLARLAAGYVGGSVQGYLGDPRMQLRLTLIMREYAAPTSAFDIIFEGFIEPHHGALSLLVAAAIGAPVNDPETIVRTHMLVGQVMVLLLGRPVLLRRLDWKGFSPARIDQVSEYVSRAVLGSLGLETDIA